ncbi:ATP-binding cassette domain-containing protein [Salmonella enterica]|uniref:ATP-binding cassette domain-containing protein n=1 Tax=Salmonella enterica TaxID=28901 RepID=UPI000D1148DE|nr:ATP-binding cassette domain-containing protein [Salmonella enterica]HAR9403429.1 ATP-binding cassette domain-containing protein [Salmonella enterica subsp. enterica serovar 4,[5],12:i:-]
MSQPLLAVNGLMMRFGGLLAVNNVSLELREREIVSLIGPNGAGKTTVFNCLTGFYKPTGGTITLRERHLEGLPGQQIFDTIEQLREQGMTIFLVEQNANQALKLADRGYVLENGHVVLSDTGDALLANEAVRSAYLGG